MSRRYRWFAGVASAFAGVAAAELLAAPSRGVSLVDGVSRLVVDTAPRPVVDVIVRRLRSYDKPAVRVAVVATTAVIGGFALGWSRGRGRRLALTAGVGVAAATAALRHPPRTIAPVLAAAGGGAIVAAGSAGRIRSVADAAGVATAGAAALWLARRWRRHDETRFDTRAAVRLPPPERVLPPAIDGAEGWPGATPLLTPTEAFYVVDVNLGVPRVDVSSWRLRVRGMVSRPVELSFGDLTELGLVEFDAVMVCVHNQLGWHRLGNARWTGVPLSRLLSEAAPATGARRVVTRAADDYTISLPLDLLDRQPAYVVVGMNGEPLQAAHGFPARVFVPGLYGQYTGVKWLSELEVTGAAHMDYWWRRGWTHDPLQVRPMSRIDSPARGLLPSGQVMVTGVAWAPPEGVARVEVAVDDGPWLPAELAAELSGASWRRWRLPISLTTGDHRLRTRAVSHTGVVQDGLPRKPYPSGVSGYHTLAVTAL